MRARTNACNGAGGRVGFDWNIVSAGPLMLVVSQQMDRHIALIAASAAILSALLVIGTTAPVREPEAEPVPLAVPDGQAIRGLILSEDDRLAALFVKSGPRDIQYRLDIVATRDGIRIQSVDALYPRIVAFSPTGRFLAIVGGTNLTVHDITNGATIIDIAMLKRVLTIGAIAFTEDESGICVVGEFGEDLPEPNSWHFTSTTAADASVRPHKWYGRHLSPDGKRIRHGGWPGPIPRVRDSIDSESYAFLPEWPHPWPIAAGFTPDSQAYFSIHEDGTIYVWKFGRSSNGPTATLTSTATIPDVDSARGFDIMNTRPALAYIDAADRLRTVNLRAAR